MKERVRRKARRRDPARAELAPSDEFESPADVVEDPTLSVIDKERAIDQWKADAKALSRAENEGMVGGEPSRLDEVEEARRRILEMKAHLNK